MGPEDSVSERVLRENLWFYRAFESLDIAEMEQVWAHGDDVTCVHPGWSPLTGWTAVRDSWAAIFSNTTLMQFRITDAQVTAVGECAWVCCTENITSVVNGAVSESKVQATNIFVLRGERWLMMVHHGSPVYRF